jgi:hypothetical protein
MQIRDKEFGLLIWVALPPKTNDQWILFSLNRTAVIIGCEQYFMFPSGVAYGPNAARDSHLE